MCLFVVAFVLWSAQADPQQPGLQALDRGDYQTAKQVFSKLAASDPKDYSAFFNLALAESALHEDTKATSDFQQTLALKPSLFEAELNLGLLYLRNQRAADAIPLLQDAARQRDTDVRPRRYLGDAYLASAKYEAAAGAFGDALKLNANSAPAELGLGQSLMHQGKLDEAKPYYEKAAQLDPKLKSYLTELAQAYEADKRTQPAIDLLKGSGDDPAVLEHLGQLYLANNQPEQAATEFGRAVALSPTPANQMALASAYLKNNQPKLASPLLEAALASNPNDYDLRMVVGRLHRDQHDYQHAAEQFLAAAGIKPDSVEAWNEAATVFIVSQQYPQALAALDKVHGLNGDSAGDFYYRAIALDKLHKLKPAIESYRKFLEMSNGRFPDQEFNARQRSKTLEHEVNR